jgi:L-asparaginase
MSICTMVVAISTLLTAYASETELPRIRLVATGGTIAGGVSGNLNAADLAALVPDLAAVASVELEDFVNIPSSRMTPETQFRLAQRVNTLFADDSGLAGIVVTHGTDSLEETAFLIDLLMTDSRPVVFTAAQRPPRLSDTDGPRNLLNAVTLAATPEASDLGVLVTLNDEIHAAREVRKTHATALDAFQSPASGMMGYIDEGRVHLIYRPLRRLTLSASEMEPSVDLISLVAGGDGHLIDAAVASGAKGIVVEVFGRGNVPESVTPSIRRALEAGTTVVFVTRTGEGRTILYPPFDSLGVINGEDLDGLKARMLLVAILRSNPSKRLIQEYFSTLAGATGAANGR